MSAHAHPCRQQHPPPRSPTSVVRTGPSRPPQAPRRPHRARAVAKRRRRHGKGQPTKGPCKTKKEKRKGTAKKSSTKAFFPSCISEHFHRELWAFLTSHRQVLTIGILALALYSAHTALIFSFFYSTRLVIQRRVLRLQIDDLRADLEGLYYRKEVYTYYSRLLHRQFMAVLGSI